MQPQPQMASMQKIPPETCTELRRLAHDLSNAIETIMQASYLLGMSKLEETPAKWAGLIDTACKDAARINKEIREILRTNS